MKQSTTKCLRTWLYGDLKILSFDNCYVKDVKEIDERVEKMANFYQDGRDLWTGKKLPQETLKNLQETNQQKVRKKR